MRLFPTLLLVLVGTTACKGGPSTAVSGPFDPGGGHYGRWVGAMTDPAFEYRGPINSPQIDADDKPTVPLHLFGNDAWSGFALASGAVTLFNRLGGPMFFGSFGGRTRLQCPDGRTAEVERADPDQQFALRFSASALVQELRPLGRPVRIRTEFPPGATFTVLRTASVVSSAGCLWSDAFALQALPLETSLLVPAGALADIQEGRARRNLNYEFSLQQPEPGLVTVAILPVTPEAEVPPADFGPYPARLIIRAADGGRLELAAETDGTLLSLAPGGPAVALGAHQRIWIGRTIASDDNTVTYEVSLEPRLPVTLPPARAVQPVEFSGQEVPAWVTREWAWHSRELAAGAAYDGGWDEIFVDQGSAYTYIHGAAGAVRDFALNAIGLTAVRPDLAASTLRVAMSWTTRDGHTFYAGGGFGTLSDVAIREESTDLDLFLLWSIIRYVGLTRDFSFLDQSVPFADGGASRVRERLDLALSHLMRSTGLGDNGWLRVGSGDWSDGILFFSPDFDLTRKRGESFFNTAMALYVLPRVLPWIRRWNPPLAEEAEDFVRELRTAAATGWRGRWFVRGSFGDGGYLGEDRPFLDSNVWALWAGIGGPETAAVLAASLNAELDRDEPIGARIVYPPSEIAADVLVPGWDVNGGIWPALQGLLAPAYATVDPRLGWASLTEATLRQHALIYPDVWYGIWTGPDSYNAAYADRPGETFVHLATPMISFPAANMNVHSGPILALDHLIGLEPVTTGVRVEPRLPFDGFHYTHALVEIHWGRDVISLAFRGRAGEGDQWLVAVPSDWTEICRGQEQIGRDAEGLVRVPLGVVELTPCGHH